jgi:hypothetical protein
MTNLPNDTQGSEAAERRSRLLGVKLRALISDHLGREVVDETSGFPDGAAVLVGDAAWVLADGDASRSLGGALSWAVRQPATSLNLIASSGTGLLARRADRFRFPVSVWFPKDRELLPAMAAPIPDVPSPSPDHLELRTMIEQAGATVNVEHGVLFGEVRGLEVCRVVDQPTVGLFAELGDISSDPTAPLLDAVDATAALERREYGGVRLEVGVGANDREAFQLLHGDIPTIEALSGVVEAVETHRTFDARQHPLNRLGQERFLRWRLEQEPGLIGMAELVPADSPVPRRNLKDPVPCVARAQSDDAVAMVVCSTGIDLDLIPFAADVQAMYTDPVIVVTPERDLVSITRDMAGLLAAPVELRSVS